MWRAGSDRVVVADMPLDHVYQPNPWYILSRRIVPGSQCERCRHRPMDDMFDVSVVTPSWRSLYEQITATLISASIGELVSPHIRPTPSGRRFAARIICPSA